MINSVDEAAAAERVVTCTAKMFNSVSEHKESVSGLILNNIYKHVTTCSSMTIYFKVK